MADKHDGPVEHSAVTQMGATFKERAAAARKQAQKKAVPASSAENKAVDKSATSKK